MFQWNDNDVRYDRTARPDETEALCAAVSMPAVSQGDNIICRQVPVCLYLGLQSQHLLRPTLNTRSDPPRG